MKIDFLRALKLVLYAVSFGEIFLLGFIAEKTRANTKMMMTALALLVLNIIIYKSAVLYRKKRGGKDGV